MKAKPRSDAGQLDSSQSQFEQPSCRFHLRLIEESSVPVDFPAQARSTADRLIEMAFAEDLRDAGDLTCAALLDAAEQGTVEIVARQEGVLAGLPVAEMVFVSLDPHVRFGANVEDGVSLDAGTVVATVSGSLPSLLTGERTALNFLTHLSGVATLTREFVTAAGNPQVAILDTRKTLPGWRALQKYAVTAGGGANHRMGLYDGVLIKDNHLAAWMRRSESSSIAEAVLRSRDVSPEGVSIEVEVDTLEQLMDALAGEPDIVLLDNMNCATLREAVGIRNEQAPGVLLEASGGVTLDAIGEIAGTGVERISVGALTHSAVALDLAFDWYLNL